MDNRERITVRYVFENGIRSLKSAGVQAPALEAGVMLCHVIKKDKSFLYAHDDHTLSDREMQAYFEMIEDRMNGVPLQYITGRQEFMSLEISVCRDVLIPRHETEILVQTVLDHIYKTHRKKEHTFSILDMCTGSGCIAVSLAHYAPNCRITAADVSEKAVGIAVMNAKNIGVDGRISFICGNLFEPFKTCDKTAAAFDVIVCNPPYIPSCEIRTLQREIREHEPLAALDGGPDGLDFYRNIIGESVHYLNPGGLLAFEVGFNQAGSVCRLMDEYYRDIYTVKDLSQVARVVAGRLPVYSNEGFISGIEFTVI